jgi:hypothetical protein
MYRNVLLEERIFPNVKSKLPGTNDPGQFLILAFIPPETYKVNCSVGGNTCSIKY